ncbi:MAG: 7-cyano-7-deazaguanine synthase QueC [Calditrichaceae bacterium]|nr:7-cyano-7-deazaguanine synthase QueC [Calditrichaceae bacterium]
MSKSKAVVLVSGGMDSCVTTAIAAQEYELVFLHLNYGQRTEKRELQAFNDIADHYGVTQKLVVDVQFLKEIGGSSLTDRRIEVSKADLETIEIPTSYVPFRNGNILSIAASWAEVIGATKIFVGAVEEDSSGYPDCRHTFFAAFQQAVNLGTKPDTTIEIITPLIHLTKAEIIKEGLRLKAPLEKTWSCYQSEDLACGVCDSCALRLQGFQLAGLEDPIEYKVRPRYTRV